MINLGYERLETSHWGVLIVVDNNKGQSAVIEKDTRNA
jgi:hypothetical protein